MRLVLGAFALASIAACIPEGGSAPVGGNDVAAWAANDAVQEDIIGKYVVKYVNGAPPTINIEGYEPTITIGAERIHFQSQCIYADWTYKRDGEAISTQTYFVPGSGMCARGLAPGETAIQEAFEKASTMRRISGGLHVEGGGYRLELERIVDEDRTGVHKVRR